MRRYTQRKYYSLTPELAYLVGLMAADGCLINNGRHLNVTSKDIEIIENVQYILDMNVKVGTKRGGYAHSQLAYNLQFSNVALYDFLLSLGLTPAKSKTIGALSINDEYYPDFLRGYFDGDGTVWGFKDKRWKSSYMYYTGFVSASLDFLHWIQNANTRLFEVSSGAIHSQPRAYVLTYAKVDSRKLFRAMYHSNSLEGPRLTRKYTKFVDFLRSDPYNDLDARVL